MSSETIYLLLPEVILALLATLVYLGGAFLPARRGWSWLAAGSILLSAVALYQQGSTHPVHDADGPISVDVFSTTLRWAILGVGLVFVMLAARRSEDDESSEFMGSLLMILVGTALALDSPRGRFTKIRPDA